MEIFKFKANRNGTNDILSLGSVETYFIDNDAKSICVNGYVHEFIVVVRMFSADEIKDIYKYFIKKHGVFS